MTSQPVDPGFRKSQGGSLRTATRSIHPTTFAARWTWRLRGLGAWAIQSVTPASWWNARTIPGELVIATNSYLAERAVSKFLEHRHRARLLRILEYEPLFKPMDGEYANDRIVRAAWSARVPRGLERAILFDLEHFVAMMLEWDGGYRGIDPHLSIAIARQSIAAHKARRVVASNLVRETVPSGPVEINDNDHEKYMQMVLSEPRVDPPMRPVTVAILDSAFEYQHADSRVAGRIKDGVLNDQQADLPRLAHGAITASIIGRVAPTAQVVVYPVVGGGAIVHEVLVMTSLVRAIKHSQADVVVMCLQLQEQSEVLGARDALEMALDGVTDQPVIIVAAGNRRDGEPDAARYPAIHGAVMMVGAIDGSRRCTRYSRFAYSKGAEPGVHVVSPGGSDPFDYPDEYPVSVLGQRFAGTSIAAAYAAGVIARSIATSKESPIRATVLSRVKSAALFDNGWDETHYGKGLVREVVLDG